MRSHNLIQRPQFSTKKTYVKALQKFIAIICLCVLAAVTTYGQGCDMGDAYAYTDVWSQGGETDSDSDGIYDYNHVNATSPHAFGQGVVENAYNTCGHEYYSEVTMTGPDGSMSYGLGGASLAIIIDGDYFADSQLFYYCPIAGRDFPSGFSSNYLSADGLNDVYYSYRSQYTIATLQWKGCRYRACADSNPNPPSGCFDPDFVDIRRSWETCSLGVRSTLTKVRLPFIGFSFCVEVSHADLNFDPCQHVGVMP